MGKRIIGILFLLALGKAYAQETTGKAMRWMTLSEAEAAVAREPRPILIDLYTDWCGWCKVMDKRTYQDKKVAAYLNSHFYAVKLDAESRQSLQFQGRSFAFNPQYKTNEIALYLSGGQLSYPTTVIIPPNGEGPQPIPGYLAPNELELIVKYFGEGAYRKQDFPSYQKKFKGEW